MSKHSEETIIIGVHGVFCSFGDAIEFIKFSNMSLCDRIDTINKVKYLYKIFYDTDIKDNVAYPDVYSMVQYGGDMTISQYREQVQSFKSDAEIRKRDDYMDSFDE